MTVTYQSKDRSKKERQRTAIVAVLEELHPHGASSRTIQDRIYDRLGPATPCPTNWPLKVGWFLRRPKH